MQLSKRITYLSPNKKTPNNSQRGDNHPPVIKCFYNFIKFYDTILACNFNTLNSMVCARNVHFIIIVL